MPVVLGVDVGTSRVKVAAYDERGRQRAAAARDLRRIEVPPDRVEQEPRELLDAVAQATREVAAATGDDVAAVACGTAMHSLLALDARDRPLTRLITWADTRAAEQARELRARPEAGELARRTGTPIAAMSPLVKLRWFAERQPEIAERAVRWVSMKEVLLRHLTGETVVDSSIASASGLLDLAREEWDGEALALAGVRREQLSPLAPTTAVAGRLRAEAAADLGLPAGLPVVTGAADGCLENLGAGAIDEGDTAVTIGTSGAVRTMVAQPSGDPTGRLFCYALLPGRWVVGGPISNGGLVTHWARERLFPELARDREASHYELFEQLAGAVPAGADGLVCLPALIGERAPEWDPDLRGVLVGLSPAHGREHLLRALLEGVAYQLAVVYEAVAEGRALGAVHASGGFTSSALWLRIVAGVLDRPLVVPDESRGAAFGAALLGLEAMGLADALALARDATTRRQVVAPDPADREAYRRTLAVYRGLSGALREQFAALAALRD